MSPAAAHSDHRLLYYKIFGALMVCTALTVGVAQLNLGYPGGVIVALTIAAFKATLVVLFFMHVKFEVKTIYILIGVPLVLSAILMLALLPDMTAGIY